MMRMINSVTGSVGDQPAEVTGKERCKSVAVPQL